MPIIPHWHNLSYNSKFFNVFNIIKIIHVNNSITKFNPIFFTNAEMG